MALTEEQAVELGSHCPSQRILEQLPVSIELAKAYQEELGAKFPAAKVTELSSYFDEIKTLLSDQSGGKFDAHTGNVEVDAKIKVLKERIRDIVSAADNTYDGEPEIRDKFHVGPLGRSVPDMIKKAETIIALAQKNAEDLAEWGLSAEDIVETSTALDEVSSAGTAQELGVKNLPPKTRKLYAAKGRAFTLLKKLNRAAKRRFASDPTTAAKFNLDILNRKGKSKGPGEEPPAPAQG